MPMSIDKQMLMTGDMCAKDLTNMQQDCMLKIGMLTLVVLFCSVLLFS